MNSLHRCGIVDGRRYDNQPVALLAMIVLLRSRQDVHRKLLEDEKARRPVVKIELNALLNEKQAEAVMKAAVATYMQIQGSPGTGKTDVSSAIVSNWVWQSQNYNYYDKAETICSKLPLASENQKAIGKVANSSKVLVVCGTNAGLENLMKAILKKEPWLKVIKVDKETEDRSIIENTFEFEYMNRYPDYELHD